MSLPQDRLKPMIFFWGGGEILTKLFLLLECNEILYKNIDRPFFFISVKCKICMHVE